MIINLGIEQIKLPALDYFEFYMKFIWYMQIFWYEKLEYEMS